MSVFPFSQALDVLTTSSAKKTNLGSAMSYARSKASSRMALSPGQESLMLGMQGSLNLLTLSISHSLQPVAQVTTSGKREQALQKLKTEDDDLARPLKAFIQSMIVHDPGFIDVYMWMEDKVERDEYVMLEYTRSPFNTSA